MAIKRNFRRHSIGKVHSFLNFYSSTVSSFLGEYCQTVIGLISQFYDFLIISQINCDQFSHLFKKLVKLLITPITLYELKIICKSFSFRLPFSFVILVLA